MRSKNHMDTAILCSGIALGVYVPGLLLRDALEPDRKAEIFVLENLFPNNYKDDILRNKEAFHSNMRIAKKGHQKATDLSNHCSRERLEELFQYWISKEMREFILISGYWQAIMEQFAKIYPQYQINIACIHMDAGMANSWSNSNNVNLSWNHYRLFDGENSKINFTISQKSNIKPFREREDRILLHGGGWGMGDYEDVVRCLLNNNVMINHVMYYRKEYKKILKENLKILYLDEEWKPWERGKDGEYTYPRMAELRGEKEINISRNDLYGSVKAIVSKPGGGTLLDSLEYQIPIVFAGSLGYWEEKNAELWIDLGFGMWFDEWTRKGFSFLVLEEMHERIMKEKKVIPLLEEVIKWNSLKQQ
jgi:hypothetical protein